MIAMSAEARAVFLVVFAIVVLTVWIRDLRKDTPRVQAWLVADGMRKLRERAEAAERSNVEAQPCGYREAPLAANVEAPAGFFARMKARRRAKQMLAMEREAER